jgi:vacuolar-type H+-ATPase subunit E/Vma4
MRRYRARRRAAGLRAKTTWRPRKEIWSDHRIADAKNLALHAMAAMRIAANPRLLDRVRATVRTWLDRYEKRPPAALLEWKALLARPWKEVVVRATEMGEDAARMRQSSPLATLLSEAERRRVQNAFRISARASRDATR